MCKKKDKIKRIKENQWHGLKIEVRTSCNAILNTVEILLNHTNNPEYTKDTTIHMCAGLYTHAIEEYGKLVYLKSLTPVNDIIEIEYSAKFTNHKFKFSLAIDNLPKECTELHTGVFDSAIFDSADFDTDTVSEWQTRLNIFNVDLDGYGNVVEYPSIDLDNLNTAVLKFKEILLDQN